MSVRRRIASDSETLNTGILLAIGVNPLANAVNLFHQVVDCSEVDIIVQVRLVVTDILDNCLLLACVDRQGVNRRGLDVRRRNKRC